MHPEDIDARDKFLFTLEWLLEITKRYSGRMRFGLAHISSESLRVMGNTYGAQSASLKLDEISHSLRSAFRKTDLVARDGADFWILVPYTPPSEQLLDKVKYIAETASHCGLEIMENDISIFSLPNSKSHVDFECSATQFLNYLKQNRQTLAYPYILLPIEDE